jgi:hypothetical protein
MGCSSKIVVFDLDETLGYFMELGMFWDALKGYIKHKQLKITTDQNLFNDVLDLYPEFLRPNITGILNYLKKKKEKNHCDQLMIYTNNQGPVEWAKFIMNYFEKKINYKIFDQIIGAFKVQGKRIELCRTTHMKTHKDFIKCTKVPEHTQICFLDDVFYPDMSNEKIYYINLKPYIHDLDFNEMISRLLKSSILGGDFEDPTYCREYILAFMSKYNYIYVGKTATAQDVDKVLSKKILQHLHTFFKMKPIGPDTNKTHKITKRHKSIHNKTLKNRKY